MPSRIFPNLQFTAATIVHDEFIVHAFLAWHCFFFLLVLVQWFFDWSEEW
jgi:hypothetical protein